jgi:hypothetical protein
VRSEDCREVDLQSLPDARGGLVVAEHARHFPFVVRRIYLLHGVPPGTVRGQHGHRTLQQLFIAASGSFRLTVDDGTTRRSFVLDRPDHGVYLGSMMWREVNDFSPSGACLVLASAEYDPADYIYHYDEFVAERRRRDRP